MKYVLALLLIPAGAMANDGRDRYQVGYPNLFHHWHEPVAAGAGYRVLSEDMAGGADGDPAYRWAQEHAIAVVEIAAYETAHAMGPAPFDMAVFDLSAENGDTPVGFGAPVHGDKPKAPRGRHPGGSHDGGLNLDLGYYLTSLKGRTLEEDYAACTNHHEGDEDANMCLGPADRLAVDHQAYFVLQLLTLHREQFAGRLLDEVGKDREVIRAVRQRLEDWVSGKFGANAQRLADFDAIVTSDRWGGWQRYHHHHLHLRIQPFSPTGEMRDAVREVVRRARAVRGDLRVTEPPRRGVLDARLMSYRLQRAIEVRLLEALEGVGRVEYRLDEGKWQPADAPGDSWRCVLDLPTGLRAKDGLARVEARIYLNEMPAVMSTNVHLPRQDARLHVAFAPGEIDGAAQLRGRLIDASVSFPARLRPLVTGVRYRVFPATGEPEVYVVDAGWFASQGGGQRTSKPGLPLRVVRAESTPVSLVEAQVMLSGRYRVTVPLWVAE